MCSIDELTQRSAQLMAEHPDPVGKLFPPVVRASFRAIEAAIVIEEAPATQAAAREAWLLAEYAVTGWIVVRAHTSIWACIEEVRRERPWSRRDLTDRIAELPGWATCPPEGERGTPAAAVGQRPGADRG